MSAIITDDFRRNQARLLVNEIKLAADGTFDSPNAQYVYGIGLGKTDPWSNDSNSNPETNASFIVDAPLGTQQENDDVIRNLFTIKTVAANGTAQLIAKNPWTTGRKYKAYDPTDNDAFYKTGDLYPCYATHNDKVYLCLSNTALSSYTETPTSSNAPAADNPFDFKRQADGYVWAHVTNVPTTKVGIQKFVTSQFVPVEKDSDLSDEITPTEESYTGGLLSYIGVANGGSGYTAATPPTVTLTLVGDSDDSPAGAAVAHTSTIKAKAIIDDGAVSRIELMADDSDDTGSASYWDTSGNIVNNVRAATVTISGGVGSGATAYARIAPHRGYAKNAIDVLPTWFIGVNADFENTEGGDAPVLDFRQVSLLKNFKRLALGLNSPDTTTDSLDALKFLTLDTPTTANLNLLQPGDIVKVSNDDGSVTTDSLMYFDRWDSGNNRFYYHQNSNAEVNMVEPFVTSNDLEVKSAADGSLSEDDILAAGITNVNDAEYRHLDSSTEEFNGEVIFHENRRPFTRGASQTEEVKLIIQL